MEATMAHPRRTIGWVSALLAGAILLFYGLIYLAVCAFLTDTE